MCPPTPCSSLLLVAFPAPPPPPVLARGLLDTQVSQGRTALPDEEEPVLFRRVVIQPLGEACVGPFCPLQG